MQGQNDEASGSQETCLILAAAMQHMGTGLADTHTHRHTHIHPPVIMIVKHLQLALAAG